MIAEGKLQHSQRQSRSLFQVLRVSVGVNRPWVTGVGVSERTGLGIEDSEDHCDELFRRKILNQHLVQANQRFARLLEKGCEGAQNASRRRHQQCRRHSFAGNIRKNHRHASIRQPEVVVPVAADVPGGNAQTINPKMFRDRRGLREQGHLDLPRFLALVSALGVAMRVVNRGRHVSRESFQQFSFLRAEPIEARALGGEDTHDLSVVNQRYIDFGKRARFASHVKGIATNVRGVASPSRESHVTDHALFSDAQALTLLVNRAAANARQHHLVRLRIADPHRGLHAAEQRSNFVGDPLHDGVEIEHSIDLLDSVVKLNQGANLLLLRAQDIVRHRKWT